MPAVVFMLTSLMWELRSHFLFLNLQSLAPDLASHSLIRLYATLVTI